MEVHKYWNVVEVDREQSVLPYEWARAEPEASEEHHAPAWYSRSAGATVHAMRERVELTRAWLTYCIET